MTSARVLGADDRDLLELILELLGDLEVEVRAGGQVDLVVTYAERGRIGEALLAAAQDTPAAAILLVVPFHDEDQERLAARLGAHAYHALDGASGPLRRNVSAALARRAASARPGSPLR